MEIPHLGVTLRVIKGAVASYTKPGKTAWSIIYKGARVGVVFMKIYDSVPLQGETHVPHHHV